MRAHAQRRGRARVLESSAARRSSSFARPPVAALLQLTVALALTLACAPDEPWRGSPVPPLAGRVVHEASFDDGVGRWDVLKLAAEDSLTLVDDPLRPGNGVARFVLRRDDPDVSDGKRAELHLDEAGGIGDGSTWWYGFRTLLPADWERDRENEILAQWKGERDADLGEASKSPALALRVRRDELYLTNRWDERPVTPDNRSPNETVWEGPLEAGRWTEWVVQVRWSFREDGLLRVWKDGRQIVEKRGPNTYNDRRGMYFKIGVYKAPWSDPDRRSVVDRREVFHDDVWVRAEGP